MYTYIYIYIYVGAAAEGCRKLQRLATLRVPQLRIKLVRSFPTQPRKSLRPVPIKLRVPGRPRNVRAENSCDSHWVRTLILVRWV